MYVLPFGLGAITCWLLFLLILGLKKCDSLHIGNRMYMVKTCQAVSGMTIFAAAYIDGNGYAG